MKIRKKVILFFSNYLPLQIWTLKCSLNSLTLQFCRYDVSALPTSVLNMATFMYKHLLGAYCFINNKSSLNVMRPSACLVINPITVNGFAQSLIAHRWIGRHVRLYDGPNPKAIHFSCLRPELFRQLLGPPGLN